MALNIWTGFHWCSPVEPSRSDIAKGLLQSSGRFGAVVVLKPNDPYFQDACNKIMQVEPAGLQQVIVRIYNDQTPTFTDFASADSWINQYVDNLNFFVNHSGRNVVIFNELNVDPKQTWIDPRTIGIISYAFQNRYWNGGNRLLYTLFPGPGGAAAGYDLTQWQSYWDTYDLRDTDHNPRTFAQVYGSNVDSHIANRTMLWHNGSGTFDRVAIHGYADNPTIFSSNIVGAGGNTALHAIEWYVTSVDQSGWCYVTECGGQCADSTQPCFGDSYSAGSALADYEYNANSRYAPGNTYGNPGLLQAVYGYILDNSDPTATVNGRYRINSNYINGYNVRRGQLGF